jgi:glycosyltransferase involved in cell wall biosynthesis
MKIVFCYQFCSLGGCETVLSTRIHELCALGVDAHALFFDGGEGERLFRDLGDRMRICRKRTEVEEKLAAVEPDFLISLDTPHILRHLEGRPAGMKFIFEVHSTYPETLKRLRLLARHELTAIFTPSHAQRQLVSSLLGRSLRCPIEVVPNPLRRSFSERRESPPHGRPIVLWVGRLDPHKNWRAFLEICRELHGRNPELEYWLVGNAMSAEEEKLRLWDEVKRGGLANRFRWLPHVEYDKMDRLYRFVAGSGGCLVSTSKQESFGMAAAEAMACSCPVVVPDIGGFRDFVIPEVTGFRYPLGQESAAVQCILRLIDDSSLRQQIVVAGAARVHSEYSARPAVLKLVEILENISNDENRIRAAG